MGNKKKHEKKENYIRGNGIPLSSAK